VVDVRDAIDDADDLAFERSWLRWPGVVQDPVANLLGEVETTAVAFDVVDHAKRMLVVAEAAPKMPPK
jgi:hypothetical protein